MRIFGKPVVNYASDEGAGGGAPPAGGAAPAGGSPPAGATPPAGGAAPAAAARPDWAPETFWDASTNAIKPEFGQHYAEVANFHKTETERLAALAARKPEDIKFEVKLPEAVKVPDGMDIKIDEKDPRVPIIREMAIKRNWDQDTVNELVALDAQMKIQDHAAEQTRLAAEDAKLGSNAKARKDAVGNFLKGLRDRNEFSAEEYEAVRVYATDAAAVSALEKLIAKANGSIPGAGGGDPPPKTAEVPMATRWYNSQKVS